MKQLLTAAVLLTLVPATTAQILDGSTWTDGQGNSCTVDVTEMPDGSLSITVTDSTGFTDPVTGTEAPNSTTENPIAESFPAAETNSPTPTEYRGRKDPANPRDKGHVERKVNGKWKKLRRTQKPKDTITPVARLEVILPPRSANGGVVDPAEAGYGPGEEGTSNPD